ncbi:hypothetical protein Tco_1218602, partial [Tanacetum coccineum]
WEWADMMVLYCRRSATEDHEFATLLWEMTVAREDMVDFVQELEIVSGVIVPVKTTEFLNKTLVKDDGRLFELPNLEREAE